MDAISHLSEDINYIYIYIHTHTHIYIYIFFFPSFSMNYLSFFSEFLLFFFFFYVAFVCTEPSKLEDFSNTW